MGIINVERLKAFGVYLGFFDDLGYLYQIENKLYTYSKHGIVRL